VGVRELIVPWKKFRSKSGNSYGKCVPLDSNLYAELVHYL